MNTPNGRNFFSPSQGPVYHVYSHYGCSSDEIDRCKICKYLLQESSYLHPSARSFISATRPPSLPPIQRPLPKSSIEPIRYPVDAYNDLYVLPDIPGSPRTRQQAEDAAILNICAKDKSIDRVILIDADQQEQEESDDNDELYVRLYEYEAEQRRNPSRRSEYR